jgi:hypothetical protein
MESAIPDPTMRYYITELNKLYLKLHDIAEGAEFDYDTLVLLDHVRCGIIKRQLQMRN